MLARAGRNYPWGKDIEDRFLEVRPFGLAGVGFSTNLGIVFLECSKALHFVETFNYV